MATDKKDYTGPERVKALQNQGMSERDAILVSMKKSKAEKKKDMGGATMQSGGEDYPYGLSISLDADTIEKLGLGNDLKVGDIVELRAKAKVQRMSQSSSEGYESRDLSLQITDLCVEDADDQHDEDDEDEEAE